MTVELLLIYNVEQEWGEAETSSKARCEVRVVIPTQEIAGAVTGWTYRS